MTRERRLTVMLIGVLAAVIVIGAGCAFSIGRDHHVAGDGIDRRSRQPSVERRSDDVDWRRPRRCGRPDARRPRRGRQAVRRGTDQSRMPRPSRDCSRATSPPSTPTTYAAWSQTVTPAQSAGWSEQSGSGPTVHQGSDIYVSDITDEAPMSVRIQFVSHRTPRSPRHRCRWTCINWDVIYSLTMVGDGTSGGDVDPRSRIWWRAGDRPLATWQPGPGRRRWHTRYGSGGPFGRWVVGRPRYGHVRTVATAATWWRGCRRLQRPGDAKRRSVTTVSSTVAPTTGASEHRSPRRATASTTAAPDRSPPVRHCWAARRQRPAASSSPRRCRSAVAGRRAPRRPASTSGTADDPARALQRTRGDRRRSRPP